MKAIPHSLLALPLSKSDHSAAIMVTKRPTGVTPAVRPYEGHQGNVRDPLSAGREVAVGTLKSKGSDQSSAVSQLQAIQLGIEYDPSPPFEAGHPDKASKVAIELMVQRNEKAHTAIRYGLERLNILAKNSSPPCDIGVARPGVVHPLG